jgi:hypothetical protein
MKHATNEPCNLNQSKRAVELSVLVHFVRNFALLRTPLVAGPPRARCNGSFVLVGGPLASHVVASQELGLCHLGPADCRQLRLRVRASPATSNARNWVRNGRLSRVRAGQSNESRRVVDLRRPLLWRCFHCLCSWADSNAVGLTSPFMGTDTG